MNIESKHVFAVFLLVFVGLVGLTTRPTYAAVHTVTNLDNDGDGSFRCAVYGAADGDVIEFDASLAGGSITVAPPTTGQCGNVMSIEIHHAITINGLGADKLTIRTDNTTDSSGSNRPLKVALDGSGTIEINNMTIQEGYASSGCAIYVSAADTLIFDHVVFQDNVCPSGTGGALTFATNGDLIIRNSAFLNNSANIGGALALTGDGVVQIINTTIANNTANQIGGAVQWNSGTVSFIQSSIVNNLLGDNGQQGIGIATNASEWYASNSIFTGGDEQYVNPWDSQALACTKAATEDGSVNLANSEFQSGDNACGFSMTGDPMLDSLTVGENGIPYYTLQSGSPAMGAGDSGVCTSAGVETCHLGAVQGGSAEPIVTEMPTEMPTDTPEPSVTEMPTEMPTDTPEPVVTEMPTDTPEPVVTEMPTEMPTDTPEPVVTDTPSPTPDTPLAVGANGAAVQTPSLIALLLTVSVLTICGTFVLWIKR